MKKVAGTRIRGNRYYLNLAVPVDLRSKYETDRLTDAIGTADPKVAEDAVTLAKARFIQDAEDLSKLLKLTPEQQKLLDEAGGLDGLLAAYNESKTSLAFMAGDFPASEGEMDELAEDMLAAEDDATSKVLNRRAREEAKTLNALGKKVVVPGGEYETLADVASYFVEKRGWTAQNAEAMEYTMRRWQEFHGDIPLPDLTREHLFQFEEAAKGLPTSTAKGIRTLPMRKAIAAAKREDLPTVGYKVRERLVNHLKAVMAWGIDRGLIKRPFDPWAGYKIDKPKERHGTRQKKKVPPFTPRETAQILAHVRKQFDRDTIDYWLPFLGAYSGARREELGQLMVDNIKTVSDIPTMQITDLDPEQKVKNQHSLRYVPIPAAVLKMGFMEFVDSRRQAGGRMLFLENFTRKNHTTIRREVPADKRGRFTENYGQRFTDKVLFPLGIKKERQAFHALRHSWTDAARRAKIDPEIRRLIAGRLEGEDPTEAGYGGAELLAEKLEALNQVEPFICA